MVDSPLCSGYCLLSSKMTSALTWTRIGSGLKAELRPLLQLAGPVVLAELGWMTMGLVDLVMVGRVGAEAIGAVGIGGTLFFTIALFGIGLLLGLDYTVAHAFGAGRLDDAHAWLVQALYLAVWTALPGIVLVQWGIPKLEAVGVRPEVLQQAIAYGRALSWSLLPLLLLTAVRRYLQAIGVVKPIMLAVLSANFINVAANWVLIFGHLGFAARGAEGAGWATCVSRLYMALCFFGYLLFYDRRHQTGLLATSLRVDGVRMRRLVALGWPAAIQTSLECGVFAAATALAGRLAPAALAAHQIALTAASFTFMVPLGVSAAGAVRVGQALGRREPHAAERSGWTALLVGAVFMMCAGLGFVLFPSAILRVFTPQEAVISVGTSLLLVAAIFQLFDGVQVVATGVLRGTGDTRTPMLSNLAGHWLLGLPVGYALCFVWGWGVTGLWVGLCLGLIAVALVLLWVWSLRVHVLAEEYATTGQDEGRTMRRPAPAAPAPKGVVL
ncbi:MAG: MATE family efflux transporter [Candidatus Binatia bacterium]